MPDALKTYRAPWQGELLLACKKCQKKLKKSAPGHPLAALKQTLKARNKQNPDHLVHVLSVPCMDLCPKAAVAVCAPAKAGDRLYILRSEDDLNTLIAS